MDDSINWLIGGAIGISGLLYIFWLLFKEPEPLEPKTKDKKQFAKHPKPVKKAKFNYVNKTMFEEGLKNLKEKTEEFDIEKLREEEEIEKGKH